MPFESINPSTLEKLGTWPALTEDEVLAAVERAGGAHGRWASLSVAERCERLRAWGGQMRLRAAPLAEIVTAEMGKPIRQSRAEVEKCAATLEFIADHAERWLAPECRSGTAHVRFDPLGVLIGVMPWNFPHWQIVRFAAGAMAAGNGVLIKPAPSTAGCALALAESAAAAGIEPGWFSILLAEVDTLEPAVAHAAVAGVSLTGSVKAGRSFAAVAARHGKPAVLELGGSDPFVVLDDADVELAARSAAAARCLCSGQSCIAAKRFIATEPVYDAFREAFVAEMRKLQLDDPSLPETDVGPLARYDLLNTLSRQRDAAVARGGRLLVNAKVPALPGYFFPPEIVELREPIGPAWCEETFGPLAALLRASDEQQALALANTTTFGLGASLWTRDLERARTVMAAQLQAGNVFINGAVRSDPSVPFGGVRASGYGRELGVEGVRQFTNVKTVWVE